MGTPTKGTPKRPKTGEGEDARSPLSRSSRWDSPNNPTNRSTPPSQRKLRFGRENAENDNESRKKKCVKVLTKEKDGRGPSVAFPGLFPEISSKKAGSRKSILLGPRLRPRDKASTAKQPERDDHRRVSTSPDDPSQLPSKRASMKSPPKAKRPCQDPMSPLQPPCNLRAKNDLFNDFALTPTVLYDGKRPGHYNRPLTAPMSSSSQHYLQSPHWSGQVRVNPFSPVPEQYLRPHPTSTKSVSRGDYRKQHPGFYQLLDLEPPMLPPDSSELRFEPRKKKARIYSAQPTRSTSRAVSAAIPRLDDFDDCGDLLNGISPTDVTQSNVAIDAELSGNKRKAHDNMMLKPPPQCMDTDAAWHGDGSKRRRIKRGRYLDDFQEVQFLGAGSFGSVNACLSRLDGVCYAIKSISPTGQIKKGNDNTGVDGLTGMEGADYLYGGRKMMSNQCGIPPTPRRDLVISPLKRKKAVSRFGLSKEESGMADDCYDLGAMEGSSHWNEGALRRMLREVFALAALCQQDDARTFHIVRYQQAWLEDDGTLYIQTELCNATLRDEMSGKVTIGDANNSKCSMDVFRQVKVLREVLLALELVHEQGMVHLDIKPENIFVKNNLYKLGDFGLANVFTKNGGEDAATPDVEEGDSRYMSKDLLDFNPKDLTKCDIFSLGATMYEVISGQPLPLCGEEWQKVRNGKMPTLPGTTPSLNAIIREMMHPDPDKRPSASDLLARDALCPEGSLKLSSNRVTMGSNMNSLKRARSWSL